jgi:hypothetical protein
MRPNAGTGGCLVSANEYSCAHGAQINFGDLTAYLTYNRNIRRLRLFYWSEVCKAHIGYHCRHDHLEAESQPSLFRMFNMEP